MDLMCEQNETIHCLNTRACYTIASGWSVKEVKQGIAQIGKNYRCAGGIVGLINDGEKTRMFGQQLVCRNRIRSCIPVH
ncbi:MAG: hypothetical protein FWG80_04950 [Alphaproteobacteria bacterium]|nr:hypothetical protein [Alphaproteobacteria bacterium]